MKYCMSLAVSGREKGPISQIRVGRRRSSVSCKLTGNKVDLEVDVDVAGQVAAIVVALVRASPQWHQVRVVCKGGGTRILGVVVLCGESLIHVPGQGLMKAKIAGTKARTTRYLNILDRLTVQTKAVGRLVISFYISYAVTVFSSLLCRPSDNRTFYQSPRCDNSIRKTPSKLGGSGRMR